MRKDYKKKANYQDSFEDLYLKHDYLTRVKPYETSIESYEHIVKTTAHIMYEKYRLTFNKVGFYMDDVVNISRTYLHAFLGLYSFETDKESLRKFKEAFTQSKGREPYEEEIAKKQRNNLIHFLRQKLSTCLSFCERKSRNIVGAKSNIDYFAYTQKSVQVPFHLILEDPEYYGYRRVNDTELKSIKVKNKTTKNQKKEMRDEFGFKVFPINTFTEIPLSLFTESFFDGNEEINLIHHDALCPSAEEKIMNLEEDVLLAKYEKQFDEMSMDEKRQLLQDFIDSTSGQKDMREEIKIAKKILERLNAVV